MAWTPFRSRAEPDAPDHGQAATAAIALREAQSRDALAYKKGLSRRDRIFARFSDHLTKAGLTGGHVVEIGGRKNPLRARLDPASFRYTAFDIVKTDPEVLVADITDCPQIPDGLCDVVISIDVYEHIKRLWKAEEEISRILKPGGISYTSTLFSWRYHPCPIDYWRFTLDCLSFLFSTLDTVEAGFDATERRRNIGRPEPQQDRRGQFGGGARTGACSSRAKALRLGVPRSTARRGQDADGVTRGRRHGERASPGQARS